MLGWLSNLKKERKVFSKAVSSDTLRNAFKVLEGRAEDKAVVGQVVRMFERYAKEGKVEDVPPLESADKVIEYTDMLKDILIEMETKSETVSIIYRTFEELKNDISKKYLLEQVENDITVLKEDIQLIQEYYPNPAREHIKWTISVLEFIKEGEAKGYDCSPEKWQSKHELTPEISKIHMSLHRQAEKIPSLAKSGRWASLFQAYNIFMKDTYNLLNLINLHVARREIEELKKDCLSGVMTRMVMERKVGEIFSQQEKFSVILFDVDNLKLINDRYGHTAGDKVISEVGKALRENLRSTDLVFRYGGDEFLVILPGAGLKEALAVANRIKRKIEETPVEHDGKKIRFTVSGGVKEIPAESSVSFEQVIKEMDVKLAIAKQKGGNAIVTD